MAVAYTMEFEGATLEQYDQVMKLMGLTEGGEPPEGAIFHWVAPTEDGIIVVDVWESDEQFDRFAEEQIGPTTARAGITSSPEVTRHEVHNLLGAPAGITAGR
jgi:hypothetical protein